MLRRKMIAVCVCRRDRRQHAQRLTRFAVEKPSAIAHRTSV